MLIMYKQSYLWIFSHKQNAHEKLDAFNVVSNTELNSFFGTIIILTLNPAIVTV